jgi:hypothetical protein
MPEGKRTQMLDLSHSKENYTHYSKKASRLLYLLFLLILSICNFLIFLGIIPLMIFIKSPLLILILGTLGLLFGLIFSFLIRDIEHLQPRHHIFAALFMPILSIINIFVLVTLGRFVQGSSSYPASTLLLASLVYVIMFLLPYSIEAIIQKYFPRPKPHKVL